MRATDEGFFCTKKIAPRGSEQNGGFSDNENFNLHTLISEDEEKPLKGFGVNWHKVENMSASGLAEGKLTEVAVGEKKIGLLKRNGTIFSFTAACPHAGGALCDGWVDPLGRIVCPEHKYRFDPANGRNTSGEGYKLFTYPVEIREGDIFVGFIA